MDCVDGYHVVELAMEERQKITYATERGPLQISPYTTRLPILWGQSYQKHRCNIGCLPQEIS